MLQKLEPSDVIWVSCFIVHMYLTLSSLFFWPLNIQKPSRLYAGLWRGLISSSAYNLLVYIPSHGVKFSLSCLLFVRHLRVPRPPLGFIPKASTGYVAAHPVSRAHLILPASMVTHQVCDVAMALKLMSGIVMQFISSWRRGDFCATSLSVDGLGYSYCLKNKDQNQIK